MSGPTPEATANFLEAIQRFEDILRLGNLMRMDQLLGEASIKYLLTKDTAAYHGLVLQSARLRGRARVVLKRLGWGVEEDWLGWI